MVSAPARARQARLAKSRGVGLRRACALTDISRSHLYYRHRLESKDDAVIQAMKALSRKPPRFGARRIRVLLGREGAKLDDIGVAFIEPGNTWQNGKNKSFNGKFRDECLSAEWFRNRMEALVVIEDWRNHYNQVRPHSSLNYCTPIEFKNSIDAPKIFEVEISR